MTYPPLTLLAAASLLAVACSPEAGEPQEENAPAGAIAADEAGGDRSTIPDKFHGQWDVAGGNCAPGSEMQLEIAGDTIIYYESVGDVRSVATVDPYAVEVTLTMAGEGESWERVERLRWLDAGRTLMTGEGENQGEEILREHCQ